MKELILSFSGNTIPELYETSFAHPLLEGKLNTIRGKSSGALPDCGTFQWTKAVKALSALVVLTKCCWLSNITNQAILKGGAGSLASSLDRAVNKNPVWLREMFGQDLAGIYLTSRLIRRTNPALRRSGPVLVTLNTSFLPPELIKICWREIIISNADTLFSLYSKLISDKPALTLIPGRLSDSLDEIKQETPDDFSSEIKEGKQKSTFGLI